MDKVRRLQGLIALQERLLETLGGLVDIDIPEPLVAEEMERRLHSIIHRLSDQGATIEQYLAATDQTEDALVNQVRVQAVAAVKADLGLRAVATQEELVVSDEEVEAEIVRMAEGSKVKPAQLRKEIERGRGLEAVRSELSRGKALQFLVDHAVVFDEEGKPLDLSERSTEA